MHAFSCSLLFGQTHCAELRMITNGRLLFRAYAQQQAEKDEGQELLRETVLDMYGPPFLPSPFFDRTLAGVCVKCAQRAWSVRAHALCAVVHVCVCWYVDVLAQRTKQTHLHKLCTPPPPHTHTHTTTTTHTHTPTHPPTAPGTWTRRRTYSSTSAGSLRATRVGEVRDRNNTAQPQPSTPSWGGPPALSHRSVCVGFSSFALFSLFSSYTL